MVGIYSSITDICIECILHGAHDSAITNVTPTQIDHASLLGIM